MILKEDVEKVRAAADLYDIVSASVTLRPSGPGLNWVSVRAASCRGTPC